MGNIALGAPEQFQGQLGQHCLCDSLGRAEPALTDHTRVFLARDSAIQQAYTGKPPGFVSGFSCLMISNERQ